MKMIFWDIMRRASNRKVLRQLWLTLLAAFVLATCVIGWETRAVVTAAAGPGKAVTALRGQLDAVQGDVNRLIDRQLRDGRIIQPKADLQNQITRMRVELADNRIVDVTDAINGLRGQIRQANAELDRPRPTPTPVPVVNAPTVAPSAGGLNVAIVMYHKTPGDFDAQLAHLEQTGYSVVTLDQVAAAMAGGVALPAKAAVITFDDGYTDQLNAFAALKRHNMKATFYIINGGEASGWCIGAGRNDHAHANCGDDYLNWEQIRTLDRSGLITIGAHTLNHPCANPTLNTASAARLHQEIADSKTGLEQELGHAVSSLAYPCGIYNQTVINEVRSDGFSTAVTTIPGTWQAAGQPYTLRRIRDTWQLK